MASNSIYGVFIENGRFSILFMREPDILVLVWYQIFVREDERDTQPQTRERVCQTLVFQSLLRNNCTQITCNTSDLRVARTRSGIRTSCTDASKDESL